MHLYEDQFSEQHDYPLVGIPSKTLIIASTGRSGSHMLGHSLHETRCFGFPLEYVNPVNLNEWRKRLGTTLFFDTLQEIQRRRTSPNGVFGIKIHYSHIKQIGGFDSLKEALPNPQFVLLRRKNVLRQAVSLSIAFQTGAWIAGQKPTCDNPRYSFQHIDACLKNIIKDDSSWRYALAAHSCNFIELDFDSVRKNTAGTIKTIADFVGVDVPPQYISTLPVTRCQSSTLNDEWERKYLQDFDDQSLLAEDIGGIKPCAINKLTSPWSRAKCIPGIVTRVAKRFHLR